MKRPRAEAGRPAAKGTAGTAGREKNAGKSARPPAKKYPAASYRDIALDRLLVCAAKRVLDAGEECTFERLVCECYTLFPESFGFQRYPRWPDALRVDGTRRRCHAGLGWLEGSTKEGFRLTPSGSAVARETEARLETGGAPRGPRVSRRARDRYEAVLQNIRNSPEYLRFAGGETAISTSRLRSFLGGTLETPRRILVQNLNLYYEAARVYDEQAVIPFLDLCRKELRKIRD